MLQPQVTSFDLQHHVIETSDMAIENKLTQIDTLLKYFICITSTLFSIYKPLNLQTLVF